MKHTGKEGRQILKFILLPLLVMGLIGMATFLYIEHYKTPSDFKTSTIVPRVDIPATAVSPVPIDPGALVVEKPPVVTLNKVTKSYPRFPGGEEAMTAYLEKEIDYPSKAREENITGVVRVAFTVDRSGKVRDAHVVQSLYPQCDAEAVKVVESMPRWKPAKFNGHTVNMKYVLPIEFKLI